MAKKQSTEALNDLCDDTQHRIGIVEGSLSAASSIVWDNAGGLTEEQATNVACIIDLALAELSRIASRLDAVTRKPSPERDALEQSEHLEQLRIKAQREGLVAA